VRHEKKQLMKLLYYFVFIDFGVNLIIQNFAAHIGLTKLILKYSLFRAVNRTITFNLDFYKTDRISNLRLDLLVLYLKINFVRIKIMNYFPINSK